VADGPNAYKRQDSQSEAAQAAKKRSRLNALIILLIPVLGTLLPSPYKACAPLLLLIPLFISLADKFRKTEGKSANSPAIQTYSIPNKDRFVEPYLYTPRDPKDPRRYKPIG
jgi:hypothetical protein